MHDRKQAINARTWVSNVKTTIKSIITLIILSAPLILSMIWPPVTADGYYLKPPVGPDPVSMVMQWTYDSIYPFDNNIGDAVYQYAMCYTFPNYLTMEVDVDPEINEKPKIIYRYGIPQYVNFENITSDIDILDNIGYSAAWKFSYSFVVWCSDDFKEILFKVRTSYDDRGEYIYAGVGDPLGPDFVEPTDFDSFYVKIVSGGFSASLQPAR